MFKSLSELMTSVGKTDAHKVSIVQVKTGVTSWGRKNQSSRPTAEYQIWMDTPDNDSRIVLKLNFVLSSRRNQPEKNAPLNIEISQYANWDSRVNMGNTTLKTVVVHPVVIVEVHDNHVIATWNGNAPRRFGESVVKGWKKEKPLLIREGFGQMRLATREEKALAGK